jgi:hypothetical protein
MAAMDAPKMLPASAPEQDTAGTVEDARPRLASCRGDHLDRDPERLDPLGEVTPQPLRHAAGQGADDHAVVAFLREHLLEEATAWRGHAYGVNRASCP